MQGSAHMTGDEATASACSLVLASWFVRARYSSSASFALLSARSRPSRSSKERSFAWHTQPPQPPSQPARHSEARARSHARTQQQVARTQRRTLLTHHVLRSHDRWERFAAARPRAVALKAVCWCPATTGTNPHRRCRRRQAVPDSRVSSADARRNRSQQRARHKQACKHSHAA